MATGVPCPVIQAAVEAYAAWRAEQETEQEEDAGLSPVCAPAGW